MSNINPIPERFNSISVYLIVPDSIQALEFYGKAFGAKTVSTVPGPGGHGTMHAEMALGDSVVMMTDENIEMGHKSPATIGGCSAGMYYYVEDADSIFNQAVAAGCEVVMPLMDAFWGDRMGSVKDPFGYVWSIATHTQDLSEEQILKGQAEWIASMSQGGQ